MFATCGKEGEQVWIGGVKNYVALRIKVAFLVKKARKRGVIHKCTPLLKKNYTIPRRRFTAYFLPLQA